MQSSWDEKPFSHILCGWNENDIGFTQQWSKQNEQHNKHTWETNKQPNSTALALRINFGSDKLRNGRFIAYARAACTFKWEKIALQRRSHAVRLFTLQLTLRACVGNRCGVDWQFVFCFWIVLNVSWNKRKIIVSTLLQCTTNPK